MALVPTSPSPRNNTHMLQDLRYALRALRSSPAFAAIAILSLALGIGANTAIFSLIDSLILKTLPVPHPEQLLQVTHGTDRWITNPLWEQLRDHGGEKGDVFSNLFAFGGTHFNLSAGGEARHADAYYVSGQFFETLGLRPALGRTLTAADDHRGCPATAVLSNAFWQKEYGARQDLIGKTISLDTHPFEIVGVIEPGFSLSVEVGNSRNRPLRPPLRRKNHQRRTQQPRQPQMVVAHRNRPTLRLSPASHRAPQNPGTRNFQGHASPKHEAG